ncbi:MAG: ATP-binding cassette domain-containing protein [Candidatus Peregrinibacteria bacterium]
MISFSHIQKQFGRHHVLNDVSFDIAQGEFLALIGKSGAGKSTLIHLLIGAETPDSGDVTVRGKSIPALSSKDLQLFRQSIGVVFQDFKLLNKKTVFENVAFALEVTGENAFIDQKVSEALFLVGLENMRDRFPPMLSGGEKQRVAIARAMVHSPVILIADEPTGNLDPENTIAIARLLRKLNLENGVTVFLTTHDPALISEVAPRILTLENGKITHDLKPGTVYPNYFG